MALSTALIALRIQYGYGAIVYTGNVEVKPFLSTAVHLEGTAFSTRKENDMAKQFTSKEWDLINARLEADPERYGLPQREYGSVLLGFFNIRKLGSSRSWSPDTWDGVQHGGLGPNRGVPRRAGSG